jgi:pimeloyl-ACP methyl ester carboxylesterase
MSVMTILSLPDGRQLSVCISGPEDGTPLIYHHGTPSGLNQIRVLRRGAHERGLRFVTYSRPGYGESTRLPGRDVAAAASDVEALLDHLGASRCLVSGWSGGGPHALASAVLLPERVAGVLVIAGAAPHDATGLDFLGGMGEGNLEEFGLAAQGEAALRPALETMAGPMATADLAMLTVDMGSLLPDADRDALTGEFGEDLAEAIAAGVRGGVDGWIDDDLAFLQPWGFSLDELAVPSFVWQGSEDLMVPFAHGQWLAKNLPGAVAHLEPGQGHLSIVATFATTMLDELAHTL